MSPKSVQCMHWESDPSKIEVVIDCELFYTSIFCMLKFKSISITFFSSHKVKVHFHFLRQLHLKLNKHSYLSFLLYKFVQTVFLSFVLISMKETFWFNS